MTKPLLLRPRPDGDAPAPIEFPRRGPLADLPGDAGTGDDYLRSLVSSPEIDAILDRCSGYLRAGFPVHFRGAAGTGKTTLALLLANRVGRPVTWVCGDDSFTSETLVGAEAGYRSRQVVDRYVASVVKVEYETSPRWVDKMVTTACLHGHTLVYDEFTRSPPEANSVLLPVLEERILVLPTAGKAGTRHQVHPEFRAIFTSNPEDHVGVHELQDALADRMITIDVEFYDRDTEVAIVAARSGLAPGLVAPIVDLVRDYRASEAYARTPTLRAAIMIATMVRQNDLAVSAADPGFVHLCLDVLAAKGMLARSGDRQMYRSLLTRLIAVYCRAPVALPPGGLTGRLNLLTGGESRP